jgi:hypothetical protein
MDAIGALARIVNITKTGTYYFWLFAATVELFSIKHHGLINT